MGDILTGAELAEIRDWLDGRSPIGLVYSRRLMLGRILDDLDTAPASLSADTARRKAAEAHAAGLQRIIDSHAAELVRAMPPEVGE